MGDFNDKIQQIDEELNLRGLKPTIPKIVGTHNKGNRLDQFFSNTPIQNWTLVQDKMTDHYPLVMDVAVTKTENDLDIR